MANTRIAGRNAVLKLGGVATPLIDVSGDMNDIAVDIAREVLDATGYGVKSLGKAPNHDSWKISAKIFNGSNISMVTSIAVGNAGVNAGYAHVPTVTIAAPTGTVNPVQATATAIVVAGSVTSVVVTNPGSGYLTVPAIGFTVTGGDTATPVATATATIGQFTEQMWAPILVDMDYVYMEFDSLGSATGKPKYTGQFVLSAYKLTTPLKGLCVIEFTGEGNGDLVRGVTP